jgi:FtsZ-interacting cell division protein ZipA
MPAWGWILIVVAAVIVVAVLGWWASRRRRTKDLQATFGSEYDRTVAQTDDRRAAESELDERRARREKLDIRPLSSADRERYGASWQRIQNRFVDEPASSLDEADRLVIEVMRTRGYPMDDFEQRSADISVDYPALVQNYRAAHGISLASANGRASTEDLRQGLVYYRSLFEELLDASAAQAEGGH